MKMAYYSIVSGAVSFGVLAGLFSGIFLLVLSGLRWISQVRLSLQEGEGYISRKVCEGDHATKVKEDGTQEFNSNNFQNAVESTTDVRKKLDKGSLQPQKAVSLNDVQVRKIIEKLLDRLVEDALEGITVDNLTTHHAKENLKELIKRIVSEVMALPHIKEIIYSSKETKILSSDFSEETCDDILAGIILNKLLKHFQQKNRKCNKKKLRRKTQNSKFREDYEGLNGSSSDWSDASLSEPLSLTIEEHIEEVTLGEISSSEELNTHEPKVTFLKVPFPESGKTVVDGDTGDSNYGKREENYSATELISSKCSWEENWIFQRKRTPSTPSVHHPVPVPMLVPKPSSEFRALVGGIDADDLSEMSDCSDSALVEYLAADADALNPSTESSKESNHFFEFNKTIFMEGISCSQERERSFGETEKISKEDIFSDSAIEFLEEDKIEGVNQGSPNLDFKGDTKKASLPEADTVGVRWTIAEREKEKWNHPVSIPENPYSLENIEKREQRKKQEYFRFGFFLPDSINFPDCFAFDKSDRNTTESFLINRDYYVSSNNTPDNCSLSGRRISDGTLKDSTTRNFKDIYISYRNKLNTISKPIENNINSYNCINSQFLNKSSTGLPNVKEIAKRFALEEVKKIEPTTGRGKGKPDGQEKQKIKGEKREETKINGKHVHSLTARSISKEFRDGLKNNRQIKDTEKMISETASNEYFHTETSTSPTIDIKNIKLFWEQLITSNSKYYST